ncbi:MAG: hypothetical protein WA667_06215 [Candidatus Nitrosopolaris sp.]
MSIAVSRCYFDAVYSQMLRNMRFSLDELRFIFSETRGVLKAKGLNFFSVRNYNDKSYSKGFSNWDKNLNKYTSLKDQFNR